MKGVGVDIIEIGRVRDAIKRQGQPFLDKLFTKKEQEYCNTYSESERHYAGRFAAKEAIVKALGTGFGKEANWLGIEILNDENGKPSVNLLDGKQVTMLISISHCKEYAVAYASWV